MSNFYMVLLQEIIVSPANKKYVLVKGNLLNYWRSGELVLL